MLILSHIILAITILLLLIISIDLFIRRGKIQKRDLVYNILYTIPSGTVIILVSPPLSWIGILIFSFLSGIFSHILVPDNKNKIIPFI